MRGLHILVLAGFAAVLLWAATALDEGGETDDVATAIIVTGLVVGAVVFGYARRRWSAAAWVTAAFVACVCVEQARWEDDPRFSGMDDLEPAFSLVATPFVALVPALGVWLGKSVAANGARRGVARVAGALTVTAMLSAALIGAWYGLVALTGETGDCMRVDCGALADLTYDAGFAVLCLCVLLAALVTRRGMRRQASTTRVLQSLSCSASSRSSHNGQR